MTHSNLRRNTFIASTFLLALALIVSLWRHASAAETKADGETAEKLTKLCDTVATVDSAKIEQILKLTVALDNTDPQHKGWLSLNNVQELCNRINNLGDQLDYVNNQLERLSTSAINEKVAALPGLTEACLAAVTSARSAVSSVNEPIKQLHDGTRSLNEDLTQARSRIDAYRKELIEAARAPHESHLNNLAMKDLFGCDVAIIGSGTDILDQSERGDFYRRVLTETTNLEWLTLNGNKLMVSPDLLGMDIVVRTFVANEEVCRTTLVRFSHGESIIIPEGTTRVIALFCKPELMKKPGQYERDQNGVRFLGKQMITTQ